VNVPHVCGDSCPEALAAVTQTRNVLVFAPTDTTLNVMSLMGVVMMVGIVVSNSILIVEFTRHLRADGVPLREAVALACRVRLRPVLMTSLATIIGLLPMAAKLGTGGPPIRPGTNGEVFGVYVAARMCRAFEEG